QKVCPLDQSHASSGVGQEGDAASIPRRAELQRRTFRSFDRSGVFPAGDAYFDQFVLGIDPINKMALGLTSPGTERIERAECVAWTSLYPDISMAVEYNEALTP